MLFSTFSFGGVLIGNWIFKTPGGESGAYLKAVQEIRKDSEQSFISIQRRFGLDVATSFASLYFSNQLNRFRKELDLYPNEFGPQNLNVDIWIILPSKNLGMHSQFSDMASDMTVVAKGAGFTKIRKVILGEHSAIESSRQLSELLQKAQQRKIILVSMAHASASVRIMMDQKHGNSLSMVKGWMSLSGLIFGSPHYFCSDRSFLDWGAGSSKYRSYSSEQRYLTKPMSWSPVRSFHFLGMKLSHQMTISETRKIFSLKAWGPNDGLNSFERYKQARGTVVPLLGQGQVIDIARNAPLFAKSLCSLVSPVPLPASSISKDSSKSISGVKIEPLQII